MGKTRTYFTTYLGHLTDLKLPKVELCIFFAISVCRNMFRMLDIYLVLYPLLVEQKGILDSLNNYVKAEGSVSNQVYIFLFRINNRVDLAISISGTIKARS